MLQGVFDCIATGDSSLSVSKRCVQDHIYKPTGRCLRDASYAVLTNYLISNPFMNGVTGYCQVLTLLTLILKSNIQGTSVYQD